MFTAIIVDDEPKSISSISIVLKNNCPFIKIVDTASFFDEALEKINLLQPDILFLDIEMPYGSGFDLLNAINTYNPEVIFVTAFEQFAIKAIKANAIDYILKPFTEVDIVHAINKAVEKVHQRKLLINSSKKSIHTSHFSKRLALPTLDGYFFVQIPEIIRCEASENYTWFYLTENRKILVSKNLADYEQLLTPFDFHRVHQSHLINIVFAVKYIKGRGGYIVMQDGTTVDVSARKKLDFLDSLFR